MNASQLRLLTSNEPGKTHLQSWLSKIAAELAEGARVLDAGCGEAPYSPLFANQRYETLDARPPATYEPTFTCPISDIPVPDNSFDAIICTQVLEHVSDPIGVLKELHRVLKPGFHCYLSLPLVFEEHEMPHDYFRYTRSGLVHMAEVSGFEVVEIFWLEGFHATISYLLGYIAKNIRYGHLRGSINKLNYGVLAVNLRFFRWALIRWSKLFSNLEMVKQDRENGMPINYAIVLRKPRIDFK